MEYICERVAAKALVTAHAVSSPPDMREVAAGNGIILAPYVNAATSIDANGILRFDSNRPPPLIQTEVANATAGWLLQKEKGPADELSIAHVARALQLPRSAFLDDLVGARWELQRLLRLYPNVMPEVIVRRFCDVHDAAVTLFHGDEPPVRVVSPWLLPMYSRLSRREKQLAHEVRRHGEPVARNERFYALSVEPELIIVVCEAGQLGLRL